MTKYLLFDASPMYLYFAIPIQIMYFAYEFIQMKHDPQSYFKDPMNWVDMLGIVSFVVLVASHLLNFKEYQLVKVVVIIQMLAKLNNFLRVFDKFGLLVCLVRTCVIQILPFTAYLFIYIGFFMLLYKVCGIVPPNRAGLSDDWNLFFYVWGNSIGNIHYPDGTTWDQNTTPLQIVLVWVVWYLNQFIVVVILLNFLISVIS